MSNIRSPTAVLYSSQPEPSGPVLVAGGGGSQRGRSPAAPAAGHTEPFYTHDLTLLPAACLPSTLLHCATHSCVFHSSANVVSFLDTDITKFTPASV